MYRTETNRGYAENAETLKNHGLRGCRGCDPCLASVDDGCLQLDARFDAPRPAIAGRPYRFLSVIRVIRGRVSYSSLVKIFSLAGRNRTGL